MVVTDISVYRGIIIIAHLVEIRRGTSWLLLTLASIVEYYSSYFQCVINMNMSSVH